MPRIKQKKDKLMRKALIICEKLAEERTGGIQTRVINYSGNLPKFDISPTILSIADYQNKITIDRDNNKFYKFPKSKFFSILKFINQNKFDIYHFLEGINNIQHFLLFIYLFLLGNKPLVSLYGGEMYDIKEINKFFKKVKMYLIQKFSYRIIVNSQATKNFIPEKYYSKTYIVNPGVNSQYLKYLDKYDKETDTFNLFFAGRLIRRKGLDDIIKAVNILKNEIKNIILNVAGSGPNLEKYQDLAEELDISDRINFLGDVKDMKKMAKLYSECNIFLMTPKLVSNPPGGYESFGCVYLEANLFSKPVIGTKHFGVQEAIKDGKTGILVKENSPEEIVRAIKKLYQDSGLANKLGENGFRRTKEIYMDINSTNQLAKVYKLENI